MVEFLYSDGEVYIFENPEAKRVKVGMTGIGVNTTLDRLNDVNDMWRLRKVTCQVCGGRLINIGGLVPRHPKIGKGCPGGNSLPLEKDVMLAQSHRESLLSRLGQLSGIEKNSATRMVNTLEERIERFRNYSPPIGEWQMAVVFFTKGIALHMALPKRMVCNLVKDIKAEYDYMFLDEFQDVTPLTFQFLRPLLKEIPFFAIGDDRQAIYGFAGGTPYFIQNLKDKVPGTARKNLIYNYRSNQTIVQTSAIFADPKAVKSVAKDPSEGKIFLIVVENEKAQVKQVAEEIRNRIKETPLMVISRNRPETNPVVKAYLDEMGKQAQFMTVHKSKGLEKEAVLIVNVIEDAEEQYTVPARDKDHPVVRYIKANGFQDAILAEEERLFYVALSRAEKYLFIVTEEKRESVFIKKIKVNQKNHEVIFLKSPLPLTKAGKE